MVNVFSDAAGKHYAVQGAKISDWLGDEKIKNRLWGRAFRQRGDDVLRHGFRNFAHIVLVGDGAVRPVHAHTLRISGACRVQPHNAIVEIERDMAPADLHRSRRDHAAILNKCELGRGAANVDVEQARHVCTRTLNRARAMGAQHRLHMVACGGSHKLARLLRQRVHDGGGVLLARGSPGHNDDAGLDVVGGNSGDDISAVDDGAQLHAMNKIALERG